MAAKSEMYQYYLEKLGISDLPDFFMKYLEAPSLTRLKGVGYFCGMDHASKDIYKFRERITRHDHSLTTCLIVWDLTRDKKAALAGLFHDVATPCFSHAIDYMNRDYEKQESTERDTARILKSDARLRKLLEADGINANEVADFKKYPVVDAERPKLCADRIDGIILTSIAWTREATRRDIARIVNDLMIFKNEDGEAEIGFKNRAVAERALELNAAINQRCDSLWDTYMMELLASITRRAIEIKCISYDDLYKYSDVEMFKIFEKSGDEELNKKLAEFKTKKLSDIPEFDAPKTKARILHPLVDGVRI